MKSRSYDAFLFPIVALIGGLVFTALFYFLLVSWLLPTLCTFIPALEKAVSKMTTEQSFAFGLLFKFLASSLALLPSILLSFICMRERRAQFKADTKGLHTPQADFRYYMKRYGKSDIITLSVFVVILYLLQVFFVSGEIINILFGVGFVIRVFGRWLSFPILILLHSLAYMGAIRIGLRRWKATILSNE